MIADTLADLPLDELLREQMEASYRLMARHHAVCAGCQNMLRCPIYAELKKEQEALLDETCRALVARGAK